MWGIKIKNVDWGCTAWCKENGEVELYATFDEAEEVARKYRTMYGCNNENLFWVENY